MEAPVRFLPAGKNRIGENRADIGIPVFPVDVPELLYPVLLPKKACTTNIPVRCSCTKGIELRHRVADPEK